MDSNVRNAAYILTYKALKSGQNILARCSLLDFIKDFHIWNLKHFKYFISNKIFTDEKINYKIMEMFAFAV